VQLWTERLAPRPTITKARSTLFETKQDAAPRETLIEELYSGKVSPRIAGCVAPLLNLQMRAIQATDLEMRIAKLERSQTDSREPAHDDPDISPNGAERGSGPAEIGKGVAIWLVYRGKTPQNRRLDGLSRLTLQSHRSHPGLGDDGESVRLVPEEVFDLNVHHFHEKWQAEHQIPLT